MGVYSAASSGSDRELVWKRSIQRQINELKRLKHGHMTIREGESLLVEAGGSIVDLNTNPGLDDGNIDDTFVMPTLAEWVPDGDPDYWVYGTTVYTEDEANDLDSSIYYFASASCSNGDFEIYNEVVESADFPEFFRLLQPAWVMPLASQDTEIYVGNATVNTAGGFGPIGSLAGSLTFCQLTVTPWFRGLNELESCGLIVDDDMSVDLRGWGAGLGEVHAMPESSNPSTFADVTQHALLVLSAQIGLGATYDYLGTIQFTGVKAVQA